METKGSNNVRHQAIRERDEILRAAGINRNPVGMKFMLVGEWKLEGEEEVRHSHVEGTVTGFSIDQTPRTEYKKGVSLIVDQPFIFDLDLVCLFPKDPSNNLWTALFFDEDAPDEEFSCFEVDVFVFFDAF